MAKLETIFCVMTCGLMNALLLAVTFDAALPEAPPPAVHIAGAAAALAA